MFIWYDAGRSAGDVRGEAWIHEKEVSENTNKS
jgi:hypothetical protein